MRLLTIVADACDAMRLFRSARWLTGSRVTSVHARWVVASTAAGSTASARVHDRPAANAVCLMPRCWLPVMLGVHVTLLSDTKRTLGAYQCVVLIGTAIDYLRVVRPHETG